MCDCPLRNERGFHKEDCACPCHRPQRLRVAFREPSDIGKWMVSMAMLGQMHNEEMARRVAQEGEK